MYQKEYVLQSSSFFAQILMNRNITFEIQDQTPSSKRKRKREASIAFEVHLITYNQDGESREFEAPFTLGSLRS